MSSNSTSSPGRRPGARSSSAIRVRNEGPPHDLLRFGVVSLDGPALQRERRHRRIALFSNKHEFGIIEYPDSDKIGVWGRQDESLDHVIRRSPDLDYWDGERP